MDLTPEELAKLQVELDGLVKRESGLQLLMQEADSATVLVRARQREIRLLLASDGATAEAAITAKVAEVEKLQAMLTVDAVADEAEKRKPVEAVPIEEPIVEDPLLAGLPGNPVLLSG